MSKLALQITQQLTNASRITSVDAIVLFFKILFPYLDYLIH